MTYAEQIQLLEAASLENFQEVFVATVTAFPERRAETERLRKRLLGLETTQTVVSGSFARGFTTHL